MFDCLKTLIHDERVYFWLLREWNRARRLSISVTGERALIVPCDPWSVVGSRGDQAMITAILQHLREGNPTVEVDILADSHQTDEAIRAMGMNPLVEWNASFAAWMEKNAAKYSRVFIVGADVTDGVYGFPTAMKMLMFYDVFTKLGTQTRYLGFSWSKTPHRMMKRVLRHLTSGLPLPVRDPVSFGRLERFTDHRPIALVADAAFMMKPNLTPRAAAVVGWCTAERTDGKKVIAVNIHPMFNDVNAKSESWNTAFVSTLSVLMGKRSEVSLLFLPHDNRPRVSDQKLLAALYAAMPADLLPRCHLVDEVMNADEIKAVLGSVDGLIAGRMHISIAALGQGVPVFALVYQGKFEGLWQLFGLSDETMVLPGMFLEDKRLVESKLNSFVTALDELSRQIKDRLPQVLEKSAQNFIRATPSFDN